MNLKLDMLKNLNIATMILNHRDAKNTLNKDISLSASIIRNYYSLIAKVENENLNNIFIDGKYIKNLCNIDLDADLEKVYKNTLVKINNESCKLSFITMKLSKGEIYNITFFNKTYEFLLENDINRFLNIELDQNEFNNDLIIFNNINKNIYEEYIKISNEKIDKLSSNKDLMNLLISTSGNLTELLNTFKEVLKSYEDKNIEIKYINTMNELKSKGSILLDNIYFLRDRFNHLINIDLKHINEDKFKFNKIDTEFDTCIKAVLELSGIIFIIEGLNSSGFALEFNDKSQHDEFIRENGSVVKFDGDIYDLINHILGKDIDFITLKNIKHKQLEFINWSLNK